MKISRAPFLPLFLMATIGALWVVYPAFALEVRVMDRAEVTGTKITLGDVARFSNESDPRIPELKGILLGSAPATGKVAVLDRASLTQRLARLEGQRDLRLRLPAELQVTRHQGRKISRDEFERIFSRHVREHMRWAPEQVKIREIMAPDSISLPEGRVSYRVKPLGKTDYVGAVSLSVTFFVDGVQQQTVRVSGQIEVLQQVLVATKEIKRRQEIGSDMVAVKPMIITGSAVSALTRPEDVIGMETVQAIRAGEPILASMLKRAPAIRRGEQLVLVAESDNLKVITTARALEDGYEGAQVRVANTASGREIHGRVIGPRRVLVAF